MAASSRSPPCWPLSPSSRDALRRREDRKAEGQKEGFVPLSMQVAERLEGQRRDRPQPRQQEQNGRQVSTSDETDKAISAPRTYPATAASSSPQRESGDFEVRWTWRNDFGPDSGLSCAET